MSVATDFRLLPPAALPAVPRLDASQQAVVDRVAEPGCGPLVVLAGPGTGKTTTIVEAVAARVQAGTDPSRVLALTFSRRAAYDLRERLSTRLRVTTQGHLAWTFHGFAFGLAQQLAAAEGDAVGVLTGPDQDAMLRDLLAGNLAGEGSVVWPEQLRAALTTVGFAQVLRSWQSRVRALGLSPTQLQPGDPAAGAAETEIWRAAAEFFTEYLDVLDARGLLDYPEMVHRAAQYADTSAGRRHLRGTYDLVVVDEYQDTDPGQERLLQALAGDGRDLVVVGDPDQSIYGFRGAEVTGLLQFRDRFRSANGDPADALTLRVCRRFGTNLLAASRSVARSLPAAGAGLADLLRQHRDLEPGPGVDSGEVQASTYASASAQWAGIADMLRREHLEAGTPWDQMAVLVRSGVRSLATARRILGAAGVPVEVAGDEVPLAAEPAVAPLLTAARFVLDPGSITPESVHAVLVSPLIGADATAVRRLGRRLRQEERLVDSRLPRPSDELIREAVLDPRDITTMEEGLVWPAQRLAELLRLGREAVDAGGTAHDLLWALWSATAWSRRLEETALAGGPDAQAAHRDLDAVVALFDAAARDSETGVHRSPLVFLDALVAQEIPGGPTEERAVAGSGVRLLTAHRSKGLEWDVVVIADVQAEVWPDVRIRAPLLHAHRLTSSGVGEPPTVAALVAEERRLFYVAVTRARRRLLVTAVDSRDDDGVRPSRFLAELGVDVITADAAARRELTVAALVAELRSVVVDEGADPDLRKAAALRLARLAQPESGPDALAASADPDNWWGVRDYSESAAPMYPEGTQLRLSASTLSAVEDCGLRWFLDHEVHAESATSEAQGFGRLVHAVAAEVAEGRTGSDAELIDGVLDRVWDALAFGSHWQSQRERAEARQALARFLAWHHGEVAAGRTLVAAEAKFQVEFEVAGRPVVLRGAADRVSIDADGRVLIADLKTGRNKPRNDDIPQHVQLGTYQWSVQHGGLSDLLPEAPVGTAAELVHLRLGRDLPAVQTQPELTPDESGRSWVDGLIDSVVAAMESESFVAKPSDYCRICSFKSVCPLMDEGRQVIT